jgi:hypothetical protein
MDKTLVGPAMPDGDHLPPERLAALADETPSPAEARHLASCPLCTEEVETYQALLALTRGERDRLDEPLLDWAALSNALAREHLLEGPAAPASRPVRAAHGRWPRLGPWGQAAAAAVLLAAGLTVGRLTAAHQPQSSPDIATNGPQGLATLARNEANIAPRQRLISDSVAFNSRGEALDALAQAETRYRHAVAYLMQSDSGALSEGADGFRTRLAALDQIERATQAALAAAPNDPVLNQWYISTIGARQATIRQLGQVQPAEQNPHRY